MFASLAHFKSLQKKKNKERAAILISASGLSRADNFVLPAGRRHRAGGGSVDYGGKERLHQSIELQLVLGLSVSPDRRRGHRDSDRDHRMLCHSQGDEESSDRGRMMRIRLL